MTALVALTKLFGDDMVKRNRGRILNLASVVSKTPAPEFSVYAASKAFVLSFSEALSKELEDTKVTCTALLPVDLNTVAWEGKSWKLFFINTAYHFVILLVAGLILFYVK